MTLAAAGVGEPAGLHPSPTLPLPCGKGREKERAFRCSLLRAPQRGIPGCAPLTRATRCRLASSLCRRQGEDLGGVLLTLVAAGVGEPAELHPSPTLPLPCGKGWEHKRAFRCSMLRAPQHGSPGCALLTRATGCRLASSLCRRQGEDRGGVLLTLAAAGVGEPAELHPSPPSPCLAAKGGSRSGLPVAPCCGRLSVAPPGALRLPGLRDAALPPPFAAGKGRTEEGGFNTQPAYCTQRLLFGILAA